MKFNIFISVFFLFSTNCFTQIKSEAEYQDTVFIRYNKDGTGNKLKYTTDTIIYESSLTRNMLIGTTILPLTYNQITAQEYGLYLTKVSKSNCKKDVTIYGGKLLDHINSITKTDSSLIIDFNIYDNCCYDFLCDISIDSTGNLNLIYNGYGPYCSCDCCFGLIYAFKREKGNEIREIKSVLLNGNKKTLKLLESK